MNLTVLLPIIFEVVLLPCAAALTVVLVQYINTKAERLREATENELIKKYSLLLEQTITICVIATNQTYVNSLKAQGKFNVEAQKVALQKTKDAIMDILTDEAKMYLSEIYEDLDTYINNQIETSVHFQKSNFFNTGNWNRQDENVDYEN